MGLGNPGKEYENTRHNAGFMFLEWLAQKCEATFVKDKYTDALLAKCNLHATLAKPQTFMNKSGFTAHKLATTYKLQPTSFLVIHDDLDIKLGEFKIQQGKGPKVHNGIASIESSLRFKDFWRVRIGIDNRERYAGTGEEYLLSNFTKEEKEKLSESFPSIFEKLEEMINSHFPNT